MVKRLRNTFRSLGLLLVLLSSSIGALAQTATVFSNDFSVSAGTSYSTSTGLIGTNTTWSLLRSGTDHGAKINSGVLTLTNDASGAYNNAGWSLAYTSTSNFAAPYTSILNTNAGVVTWTFNMRQSRSNPSSLAQGYYGNAFVLAGTSNTTATTGTGYAVVLGNSGKVDPVRLVRYTAGLRTSTNIISSNTSGLADFGNQYISVKVTYAPSTNTWQLFVRNDGSVIQDPASGILTSQGTALNSTSTGVSLPLIGAFWNTGIRSNQTSTFDNIKVTVGVPAITSISPTSKVAGSGAFTLTVNGINFTSASTIRWNGVNRQTTYNSTTQQLTASIPATDITTAGTATITVGTGTAVSNSQIFTIDPAAVPSISTSTNALAAFNTVTGTASAAQSFTSTGANLTGSITVTAPAAFEVSLASGSGYAASVNAPAATTPIYVRVKSGTAPGTYSDNIVLSTPGGASKQVAVSAVVLSAEPTVSDSPVSFSGTSSIATTVTWTNGTGTGAGTNHLVVVRPSATAAVNPVDGITYGASANFGSGAEIGAGNYVAYSGTGNSFTLTGLSPTTAYTVTVYAFNGANGTQNYKLTTPGSASVTTLAAPTAWQIANTNAVNTITFDSSVEGVNNGTYNGGSISQYPEVGELNSYSWAFTGFSGGSIAFGGESAEDSSYENGPSEGGETDGGLYAFEVAPGNVTLGFQPAAGEFAPGTATLRFQNKTNQVVTSISVGYKVYVYNDQAGSSSFNFSHSANNSTFTPVAALNLTTAAAADAAPGWKAYYKVVTISGLNIAADGYYYLRWSGATVSGTVFDGIALDDVVVVANPFNTFANFAGTAETFVLAGNANLSGNTTITGNIEFNNGKVIIGANTLTLTGTVTNTVTGGLSGGVSSNFTVNGAVNNTLSFDQTTPGTTNLFNNFVVLTTAGNTTTAANNVAVNGTLVVGELQTLNLGTSTLTGNLTTIINNGTIATQNTSTTPVAAGKTWGGVGLFNLNAASAAQTLVAGTYNNVTVNTTGGATATGSLTVNGTLHLPNANPSATAGALATGTNVLTMGANAVNTGVGDVSGIVTRNTISPNVIYTMGHPNTTILFPPVGTLPTTMSLKTTLGVAPSQKPDAIKRTSDFIQTGGTGTKAIISEHYLDSELNGNNESKLVDWVIITSTTPATLQEQSRSNYNTTENWVELGNVNVAFFNSTFGGKLLTLANSQVATSTWNGSVSNSWTTAANWTPNATPSDETRVIIPAGTPNSPTLNPTTTIGTLTIESGAVVNNPTPGATLTLTGSTGAWINNGTFNPGTGTVIFNTLPVNGTVSDATIAGTTTFNNITVASGSTLRSLTDAYIKIGGTFTKTGSFITGAVHSTVEYTGANQTVVVPNGLNSAYHNLIISGTGAILPASLNINGDLITNSAVDFSGKTIVMMGTEQEDQVIGGTVSPVFTNLTINRATGQVALSNNITVSGVLTLTSGVLDILNYNLTLGTSPVAGTFSATTMIEADANGVVRRPYTGAGSYLFPIGEGVSNHSYTPITVNVTSGTFNNAYVAVNLRDANHPDNHSVAGYFTRYWNVTQTGITNAVATITAPFIPGDAVGGQAILSAAQLNGTFDVNTNPWIKFAPLANNTLVAENAVLTPGITSVFTGITTANIAVQITGEGTFCENEVVTLTAQVSAGDPPYTFSWSNGLGNASTATPPTSTPGTATYTVTVRDANGIVSTDTAEITVTDAPEAGTLTGNQTVCEGFADPITLTGYVGNIVRWERSINPEFTNPTFLPYTTGTISGIEMGNVNSTRYFRAVVQNGSCPAVYSNYITVTVSSTTWSNGAWSAGAPTTGVAAIFTSDYTATQDIVACSIQVTNNAHVVIPTGLDVTLEGRITVSSGSFTLEENANLVQVTDVQNSGNIIVKKNSSILYKLDYTLWSSPVANQNLFAFSPSTLPNRFYEYGLNTEGNEAYISVDPYANSFQPGKGYLIRMPNTIEGSNATAWNQGTYGFSFEGVFTGVATNGDVFVPMNTQGIRITAVGNPYPSPINVHDFFEANEAVLDETSALYFWRKRNNGEETSYTTITKDVYIFNNALGGGQEWDDFFNNNTQNIPSQWVVNKGQGFYVQTKLGAANPVITFTNSMRRANAHSNQFFRTGQDDDRSRYWLNVTGNNRFSQTALVYSSTATMGIDAGRDGMMMSGGKLALYSLLGDEKLSVQARPAFVATDVVPMGFIAETAGTYTVSLHRFDGVFESDVKIFIKDNLLGITHNLKEGDYVFATEAGTFENRFEMRYESSTLGTNKPVIDANTVIVYKQDKALHINSGTAVMETINIFDIRGRLIYTAKNVNASDFVINQLQAEEQMLIVNIATDKGTVTKKVLY